MAYLEVYWNSSRGDNFTTATELGKASAKAAAYQRARQQASVEVTPKPGLVPLKLFYSDERHDNFTTATAFGERDALAAGYRFVRVEGYVWPAPQGSATELVALKLYWHEGRGDNFLTTCRADEEAAVAAGYRFVRIEAFTHSITRFD